jgi:hypothetical protein
MDSWQYELFYRNEVLRRYPFAFLIVLILREKFRLPRWFNSNAGCVDTEGERGGDTLDFLRGKI